MRNWWLVAGVMLCNIYTSKPQHAYTHLSVYQTTTHIYSLLFIYAPSGLAQCTCMEVRQGSNFVVTGQDSCENLKVRQRTLHTYVY